MRMTSLLSVLLISAVASAAVVDNGSASGEVAEKQHLITPAPTVQGATPTEPLPLIPNPVIAFQIKNVGTNLCLEPSSRETLHIFYHLVQCPALEGKQVSTMAELKQSALLLVEPSSQNVTIGSAFEETVNNATMGQKGFTCGYTGRMADGSNPEMIHMFSDDCGDYHNPWHRWNFIPVSQDQFLIQHNITTRCLHPVVNSAANNTVQIVANVKCDVNAKISLWTKLVWPISDSLQSELKAMKRTSKMY